MKNSVQPLPRIQLGDPTRWFLEFRRCVRNTTGRELGLAHLTRLLAQVLPRWRLLPVQGPDGLPIYLNLSVKEGYLTGGFDNTVGHLAPLLPLVQGGDVILDVGANVGVWSRFLLHHRRPSKLIAFEPEPRNFRLLEKNLAPYQQAVAQPLAVGDADGYAEFSEDMDSGQNFVVTDVRLASRTRKVPIVALDTWAKAFGLERLDVLKIDVEGLELQVFEGARGIIEQHLPLLYFEYIPEDGDSGLRKQQAFEWVQSLGYDIEAIRRDGTTVRVATAQSCAQVAKSSNDLLAQHPKRGSRPSS